MFDKQKKAMKFPGSKGEHQAQEEFGTTSRAIAFYNKQMLDYLNPLMQQFISTQEMVFIATSDASGSCDCSFRAGLPGFVRVLNDRVIAYPEYRGNGVMASIGNMMENPSIGMIFLDFFQSTVGLHVNGKVRIVENQELPNQLDMARAIMEDLQPTNGRYPERWVFVEVEEAYIHCSKHIPLLQKLDKEIHWGTDSTKHKSADFFKSKDCPRVWKEDE
ncbi:pyridoxamine 5'-phosphate oxidase family protein [Microcoleus sp. LEGE 07076]|uniref:pyridoxamine 5'-phosphate oxidase family protein n=1 Tax=Microcoleus sp. LEGE 07076 TaxID=915322 RepID=UPI001D14F7DD|nr:pyridoxamine 5'-phosphate oxidase family protein [Microcoleus sp. LEGE 07076]